MAGLRPSAAEKLTDTLRAWLFHQGRRDDIAAALFVHPQTVRYRLGQLRDLYGEQLEDPGFIRDASIALAYSSNSRMPSAQASGPMSSAVISG